MRLHGVAKTVVVAVLVTVGVVAVVGPMLDRQSFLHVQERSQQSLTEHQQRANRDLREMKKIGPSVVEREGQTVIAAVVEKTPTMVEGVVVKEEVARLQQKIKFLEGRMEEVAREVSQERRKKEEEQKLVPLFIITPTYNRLEQIPELTRLAQTLMHVPKLHWIVGDDTNVTNTQVVELLKRTGLPFTYLLTPMPEKFRAKKGPRPRGVANRNAGMNWLRQHVTEGVFYFADDDNTYDVRLFEEIRRTKRVSMFPVGLVTESGLSTPVVKNGKLVGFYDGWIGGRMFPVDMASFAVSVPFLLSVPDAKMPFQVSFEETGFLKSLKIKPEDLELLADNCTKVYVWHTKTQKNQPSTRDLLDPKFDGTNLRTLQLSMTFKDPPQDEGKQKEDKEEAAKKG